MKINAIRIAKKCFLCGLCVKYCPFNALKLDSKGVIIDDKHCVHCLNCVELCPNSVFVPVYSDKNTAKL